MHGMGFLVGVVSEREEVVPEREEVCQRERRCVRERGGVSERGEVCQRERAVPGGTAKEHGSTVSMETGGVA